MSDDYRPRDSPSSLHVPAAAPAVSSGAPGAIPDRDLRASVLRLTHDVASPLMIVATLSELLLDDAALQGRSRDDVRQILAAAQEISTRLQMLRDRVASADE